MIITDGARAYIEEMMKEAGTTTLRFLMQELGAAVQVIS